MNAERTRGAPVSPSGAESPENPVLLLQLSLDDCLRLHLALTIAARESPIPEDAAAYIELQRRIDRMIEGQ